MIRLRSLSKTYRGFRSLSEVNLDIRPGNAVALLGPNGSGKTTLIKCILGLVQPDKKSRIDMKDVTSIGYMPQTPSYPANLTCSQIITLLDDLAPADAKVRKKLVDSLSMDAFLVKKFSTLSQGMKQKLNILQCFMAQHPLYILDEPTASLDPLMAVFVSDLIKDVIAAGSTVIFTTHIISEVRQIADRIIVLDSGRVINDVALGDFVLPNTEGGTYRGMDAFEAALIGLVK